MMARATFWKAFRTGVANRSEGDIIEHVLVLEMFQRFSNTQTYLNKQTMSWCKDFLWRHVFLIAFVRLTERCQLATPHLFCVKEWHSNKNHSDMSRDISVACVCGKSGWALGSIDLVAWTVFWFVKDDVLDADPSRSRGFEGLATFRTLTDCRWWFDSPLVREKTQDRGPAERQRARKKSENQTLWAEMPQFVSDILQRHHVPWWRGTILSSLVLH